MLRDDLQTCGLDTGWQSKSHHCWKRRDWRSVIRVCEAPLPSPAPQRKRTNVYGERRCFPEQPAAYGPAGTHSFMDHKENSRHKCSQEAAHQPLPPQGSFPPPQGTACGLVLLPLLLFPTPHHLKKNDVPRQDPK